MMMRHCRGCRVYLLREWSGRVVSRLLTHCRLALESSLRLCRLVLPTLQHQVSARSFRFPSRMTEHLRGQGGVSGVAGGSDCLLRCLVDSFAVCSHQVAPVLHGLQRVVAASRGAAALPQARGLCRFGSGILGCSVLTADSSTNKESGSAKSPTNHSRQRRWSVGSVGSVASVRSATSQSEAWAASIGPEDPTSWSLHLREVSRVLSGMGSISRDRFSGRVHEIRSLTGSKDQLCVFENQKILNQRVSVLPFTFEVLVEPKNLLDSAGMLHSRLPIGGIEMYHMHFQNTSFVAMSLADDQACSPVGRRFSLYATMLRNRGRSANKAHMVEISRDGRAPQFFACAPFLPKQASGDCAPWFDMADDVSKMHQVVVASKSRRAVSQWVNSENKRWTAEVIARRALRVKEKMHGGGLHGGLARRRASLPASIDAGYVRRHRVNQSESSVVVEEARSVVPASKAGKIGAGTQRRGSLHSQSSWNSLPVLTEDEVLPMGGQSLPSAAWTAGDGDRAFPSLPDAVVPA